MARTLVQHLSSVTNGLRRKRQSILIYVLLAAGSIVFLIPLAWLISTALGTAEDAARIPHNFFPWPIHFENFYEAFTSGPFHVYLGNTLIVTILGVLGALISASLVSYGFARLRFRGQTFLFIVLLSTMMLPAQVLLVPKFILFRTLGWYDTLLPLFVPQWFAMNAFGVFLMRQFFMSLPFSLDDAAYLDGANRLQILWYIFLPLSKPILTTLGVLSFLHHWNDFIGPLIYTRSASRQTFALALAALPGQYSSNSHLVMAITLLFILPCIVVFFFAQRNLLKGMALSGTSGK